MNNDETKKFETDAPAIENTRSDTSITISQSEYDDLLYWVDRGQKQTSFWAMSEDWNHMLNFADELLRHAEFHHKNCNLNMMSFVSERISIIHFDHALELFMKAYLIKEGYIICKIHNNKIRNRIKKSTPIIEIINEDRTLDFTDILRLFSKYLNLSSSDKSEIDKFHKLRNEIQHRALNIPADKNGKLQKIKPVICSAYGKAFTDRTYPL